MSARISLVVLALSLAASAGAESFKSWAARGAREEREKDVKAAISAYGNALTAWESSDGAKAKAKVLCALSELKEKSGDGAGAVRDLKECLSLNKRNAKGYHRLGVMNLKAGRTSVALGDFYRAIAIDIRFAQAYADRARAYESQGELDFAREDYRQACRLGVKSACSKEKALGPKAKKKKAAKAAPAPETSPDEPEPAPEPAPAARARAPKPAPSAYYPRFKDCRAALDACVESGDSFGGCVRAAPDCSVKAVKGCCPAACLEAYQKSINRDRSEAAAYREHFSADAVCAVPPKEDEDE